MNGAQLVTSGPKGPSSPFNMLLRGLKAPPPSVSLRSCDFDRTLLSAFENDSFALRLCEGRAGFSLSGLGFKRFYRGVLMRFGVVAASCLFAFAVVGASAQGAPTCADLKLVPAPRECKAVKSLVAGTFVTEVISSKNKEDEFAASELRSLPLIKGKGVFDPDSRSPQIYLERATTAAAKEQLARAHLTFDPAMHDEGYVILPVGARGLAIIAETSAGLFYGAQTVKQLVRGDEDDAKLYVPTIRDWPAMAHRGLSDDWSRGPLPNMDFLKREIRTLAAYKYNIFSPYFEHTFAYASTPVAAFPGGAMTPEQGKELVEYAAKYHITIIPEQEAFGHLHHVLKFEQYSKLAETPHGAVLAPGDPGSSRAP